MTEVDNDEKWRDQDPVPGFVAALDKAGEQPDDGHVEKRMWGKVFADACAVMFADALRAHVAFKKLEIRPESDGSGTEPLTGVAGGGKKKVDVIASTLSTGLQIALSLKAENFPDSEGSYGKNLLNRIYELQDEVRSIHDFQPRAFVVGIFFFPLDASTDRQKRSSFARSVAQLRARSGRIDFTLPSQLNRLDWAVIGLYVPKDLDGGPKRGVVRYFDVVNQAPPKNGRPQIATTLTIEKVVEHIATEYRRDSGEIMDYVDPEDETAKD